jgi:hypothetical protein
MKILKMLFIGIFLLLAASSIAGENDTLTMGKIEYQYPAKLDTLLQNFIAKNKENQLYPGYRIQLIAGTNRQGVLKFKSDFYKEFPNMRPGLVYQQPNFKLRTGAFRTKIEAFKEMKTINKKFPDAFIIQDEIPFEDL